MKKLIKKLEAIKKFLKKYPNIKSKNKLVNRLFIDADTKLIAN